MSAWEKSKNDDLKGEIKTEENYTKNGEKGLKKATFGVINSKNLRVGIFRTPCTPSAVASPAANLFVGEKKNFKRRGGG